MAERISANLAMLMRVVDRLAPLIDRFVFLGGAVTELFITSTGVAGARQTKDIDIVVNVLNLGEYAESLRKQLTGLGLREDVRDGAPVCRWLLDDLIIDIMPTRGDIFDFSCEWYQLAYDTARPIVLPDGSAIRLVAPACFLATKLAAFSDRGRRNPMASHDLEDVIAVGRSSPISPQLHPTCGLTLPTDCHSFWIVATRWFSSPPNSCPTRTARTGSLLCSIGFAG